MIILKPGDNLLGIITNSCDYYIAYVDLKGFVSGNEMGTLTTAGGETIILYSPFEGVRQVKYMSFRSPASATISLLFRLNTEQGLVKKVFFQCNLSAGDVLEYTNDEGFRVKDSNGNLKVTTGIGGGGMNISAGTTSQNLGSVVFSNSNGVSFGLNGSTLTASVNAGGNLNVSAGTTSNNLTNVVFSNSNGITFGLNGSTVTGSHNAITSQTREAFSAQGGSSTFQTLVFTNSNGISFSNTNGSIWASHNGLTSQSNQALSGSNGSFTFQTATFGNLNGLSFYTSNGSMVGSYTVPTVTNSSWTVSAGTTSNTVSGLTFADANSISFGLDNGTITASYNHNNSGSFFAVGNTTLSSSTTQDLRSVNFRGEGIVSVGVSNSSVVISATQSNQALSAQGGSSTFQTISFNNANGLTFSNNGGAIEASYTVPTVTNSSFSVQDSATTINPVARIAFSTGNNITLSLSTGASSATVGVQHNLAGTSTGFAGNLISGSMTHNSSGLNLSLNHPAWLTTAMQSNAATISNIRVSAGTTSNLLSAITFANSNGLTFGLNASTLTASHNGLTTARASNDGIGLNTAQTNVTWTVNSNGLSLNAGGYAGTQTAATNATFTLNSNGLSLSVAAPGGGGLTNINVSAGTTSNNLSALTFNNANGITFGLNASTITASHNGLTTAAQSNQVVNSVNGSTGQISFRVGSSLSSSTNGSSITFGLATDITTALQSVGNYLTTARASNDAIGLNTAQTNVTWTVNSAGISLNAGGYAGTGTSATNASITLNSNGLAISVAAPGAGGNINISAGTTSNDLTNLVFSNSNGVSFGLNGSTVTASVNAGGGATLSGYLEAFIDKELLAAQIGNNQLFVQPMNVREAVQFDQIAWLNNYSNATNSSNSATLTLQVGFYTRTGNTLSLVTSTSNSFAVTNSGTVGSYSIYGGLREYPINLTTTFTAGNYWIGFLSRTTTGGGAGMTWSNFVASNINSAYSGRWSSANNATNQFAMGLGSYNTTTTAIADSIALSRINGSAAVNMRPVIYKLVSNDLN